MNDHERQHERDAGQGPPIDESTYGGSAAETGGLYDDAGPTTANPEGDAAGDVLDEPGPGADPAEAYRRAVDEGATDDSVDEEERGPDAGDVYRSGS